MVSRISESCLFFSKRKGVDTAIKKLNREMIYTLAKLFLNTPQVIKKPRKIY